MSLLLSEKRRKETVRARRAKARRALTLLEMLAAVAIMGMLVLMAVPYFGHDTLSNAGAHGFTRRLALDLSRARRATISTGDNHYVKFTLLSGKATDYTIMRTPNGGGSDTQIDSVRLVPDGVTVTPSSANCEFVFDGSASATYTITIDAPDRDFTITVIAATGMTRTVET